MSMKDNLSTTTFTIGTGEEFDTITRGVVVDVNHETHTATIVPNGDLFQLDAFKEKFFRSGFWGFVIGFVLGGILW